MFLNEIAQQFPLLLGLRQIDDQNTHARPALFTAREGVLKQAREDTADGGVGEGDLRGVEAIELGEIVVVELGSQLLQQRLGDVWHRCDDARDAMRETNRIGAAQTRDFGRLSVDLTSRKLPAALANEQPRVELLFRHMGAVIKRGIAQRVFRADLNVRLAVLCWRSLISLDAIELLQAQGLDVEEIADEVSRFMLEMWSPPEAGP